MPVESENDTIVVDVDDDTSVVGWNYSSAGENIYGEDDAVAGINGGSSLVGEACRCALNQGRRQRALPLCACPADCSRTRLGRGRGRPRGWDDALFDGIYSPARCQRIV